MVQDKFYGFQELAEFCEHVITSMFAVAPSNIGVGVEGLDTPPRSPSLGAKDSPPSLVEFIAYALYRTRLPLAVVHTALLLLSRLKARYPSAKGTATSPHRLFLSSIMIASKYLQDDTYSNKSWQVVSQGLFTLREVNQMERELFAFLGWNVVVRDEELTAFVKETVDSYEQHLASPVLPSVALPISSSRPSAEDRKRRRDQSSSRNSWPSSSSTESSPSSSRSSSPEDASRHRRASDAAVALLGVPHAKRRSSARISNRQASPYSSRPSSTYSSSSSSTLASPISGFTTPGSPSTPASEGPLTPPHEADCLPPTWDAKKGQVYSPTSFNGSIAVASW